MVKSDRDWEEEATAAGWYSPDEVEKIHIDTDELKEDIREELKKDMRVDAFAAVTREFERLVALDEMPRTLGDKILQVIQNEARYGRW